jgi:hypothetical protein
MLVAGRIVENTGFLQCWFASAVGSHSYYTHGLGCGYEHNRGHLLTKDFRGVLTINGLIGCGGTALSQSSPHFVLKLIF